MLLIARIKHCEAALAGGRLDEAAGLLRQADLRAHRQGQALTNAVTAALVRRGREHLDAGHTAAAYDDCRLAAELAGNTTDVAGLRKAVAEAMAGEGRRTADARREVAPARAGVDQETLRLAVDLARPEREVAGPALSLARFLLHVDGAGSFLVLRGSSCRLGPANASRSPDVPLMTAADAPAVTLVRSDHAYLLTSNRPAAVNGHDTTHALLADGDRIGLGPRCRIQFRQPSPASVTAVLHVTGARLPWGSVRQVVLMGRELVIGPSGHAHVRTRDSATQVVLHGRDDQRLLCRSIEPLAIEGRLVPNDTEVSGNTHVTAGPLGFAIEPV